MKTYIQYVNKKPKGYIGNNKIASSVHHIPWNHKKHPEKTIEIYKHMPHSFKVQTEHHECAERWKENELIKKGYSPKKAYHYAHAFALKFEEKSVPFPKTQIKRNLVKMGFLRRK